jgi:hypothetical protein
VDSWQLQDEPQGLQREQQGAIEERVEREQLPKREIPLRQEVAAEPGLESLQQAAHPRVPLHGLHVQHSETARVDLGLLLLLLPCLFLSLLLHRVA